MPTMSTRFLPAILILIAMTAAPVLAGASRPTKKLSDERPQINLEAMIPKQLGSWQVVDDRTVVFRNPQQEKALDRIYSQTLSRTYTDSRGARIMLSIAYGSDQGDSLKVHRPEVCYVSQGFQVSVVHRDTIATAFGAIPVSRVLAIQANRVEPITYWITVGNQLARTGLEQKIAQLTYGLTGHIPDGMLVRVSSIDDNQDSAFQHHQAFVDSLLGSISVDSRTRLVGQFP
jgi:EpsI family protein